MNKEMREVSISVEEAAQRLTTYVETCSFDDFLLLYTRAFGVEARWKEGSEHTIVYKDLVKEAYKMPAATKTEYKILRTGSRISWSMFEDMVINSIKYGWSLQGGISVSLNRDGSTTFAQSMTRAVNARD